MQKISKLALGIVSDLAIAFTIGLLVVAACSPFITHLQALSLKEPMNNDPRYLIAMGIVAVACLTFFVMVIANGIGQLDKTGQYNPPEDLVSIVKIILVSGITVLTLGGLKLGRNNKELENKENGESKK